MWQNESSTKKQEPLVSNPDIKLWETGSRTVEDKLQITVSNQLILLPERRFHDFVRKYVLIKPPNTHVQSQGI
jgi:hypothetical protein